MVLDYGIPGEKNSILGRVLTGERPFGKVPNHLIMLKVSHGVRPQRPSSEQIPDRIWETLRECWSDDPTQRPTLEHIITMCTIHAGQDAVAMPVYPFFLRSPFFRSGDVDGSSSSVTEARIPCFDSLFPNCPPVVYPHPDLPRVAERSLDLHSAALHPPLARGGRKPNTWGR